MGSTQPQENQTDSLSFFSDDDQTPKADVHHYQGHFQEQPAMFQFAPSTPPGPRHTQGTRISMPPQQQLHPPPQSQSHPQQIMPMMDMLGDLMNMSFQGLDSNSSQTSSSTSVPAGGGPSMAYNPQQLLLDHQFRLSQLQQLQQLQHQIFQQQIALISGQPPTFLNSTPAIDTHHDQSFTFNGLPTPAPSGELRPQQQSLDYISPMVLNNLIEAAGGAPQSHSSHQSHPSSPSLHSGTSSIISSPAFLGSTTPLGQGSNTYPSTPYAHPGSISAPEYIAFQTSPHSLSSPADLDLDISPLTSPWLGAHQISSLQNQNQPRQHQQHRPMAHLSHLGSSSSSSSSSSQGGSQYSSIPLAGSAVSSTNKRSASPSSGEADARKRRSPAVRPTNVGFAQQLDQQQQQRRTHRTGSRSTSSTPLLRARSGSTRQRKGSVAGSLNTPTVINETPGDSPSPVDLSMPPPAPPAPPNPLSGANNAQSPAIKPLQPNHGLSHLTPVTPASIMNLDVKGKRLNVITDSPPGALSNANTSPISQRNKRSVHGGLGGGTHLVSPSLKPILPGPTGNSTQPITLTPSSVTINAIGNHSSALSASSMLPPQIRKTSHKAAEQKRRDSLKTTFDELRGLLPPIPLPSTGHAGNPGEGDDGGGIVGGGTGGGTGGGGGSIGGGSGPGGTNAGSSIFGNAVKPLLPGALPPRGPPKAGGEGPNKGVSKLQLLICGNEYIKTLKGRVDRRDDEIVRLRKEVKKLRQLLGLVGNHDQGVNVLELCGKEGGSPSDVGGEEQGQPYATSVESLMEQLDLELDLDRDIDAVEKLAPGTIGTPGGGRRDDNIISSARSDLGIEDDEDED